jgi:hypothetical protein
LTGRSTPIDSMTKHTLEESSGVKPIMCCAHLVHTFSADAGAGNGNGAGASAGSLSQLQLAFVGSTDGTVSVYDIGPLVRGWSVGAGGSAGTGASGDHAKLLLCKYCAHTMGTNAISIAAVSPSADSAAHTVELVAVSGGDDGSLTIGRFQVALPSAPAAHASHGSSADVARMSLIYLARVERASGSAIKGVATDGAVVACCGYEQRLSMWELVSASVGAASAGAASAGAAYASRPDDNTNKLLHVQVLDAGVEEPTVTHTSEAAAASAVSPLRLIGECVVEVTDVEDIALTRIR